MTLTVTPRPRARLGDRLKSQGVPAVAGMDTRTLTRRTREQGNMKGRLIANGAADEQAKNSADEVEMSQVFDLVAPNQTRTYAAG